MKFKYFDIIVLMLTIGSFNNVSGANSFSDDEEREQFTRKTLGGRIGAARQFVAETAVFTEEETQLAQTIAMGLTMELNPSNHSRAKGLFEYYTSMAAELPSDLHQSSYDQAHGTGKVILKFTRYPACDKVDARRLSRVNEKDLEEEAEEQIETMRQKKIFKPKQWMLSASDGKKSFFIKIKIFDWSGLTSLNFFNHPIFEEMGVAQILDNLTQSIKVSGSSIATFDPSAFARFNNLDCLDMSHNRIDTLIPQAAAEEFSLSKLLDLNLSHNIIKRLGNFFHTGFDSLRRLILSDNQIMKLSAGSFSGLTMLQRLSLKNNFLSSADIDDNAFDKIGSDVCESRVHLDLGNNFLSTFPPVAPLQDRLVQLNLYHSVIPGEEDFFPPSRDLGYSGSCNPDSLAGSFSTSIRGKCRIHNTPPPQKKITLSPLPDTIHLFNPVQSRPVLDPITDEQVTNPVTGEPVYEESPVHWTPVQGRRGSTAFELQAVATYPPYRDSYGQKWEYQERINEEGEDVSGYYKVADDANNSDDDFGFETVVPSEVPTESPR